MKASEEIAADMFIKDCMRKGMDSHYEIVEKAGEIDGVDPSKIKELLNSGESRPFENSTPDNTCKGCGSQMMFDENGGDFYCPRCDS